MFENTNKIVYCTIVRSSCNSSDTPPPLDGSKACAEYLSERFPISIPESKIILPDNSAELIVEYDEACEQLNEVTERKQKAENQLKELMGDNEVCTSGNRIIVWKSTNQREDVSSLCTLCICILLKF